MKPINMKAINELKSELRKAFLIWKQKNNLTTNSKLEIYYSDGEYDPDILEVINNLQGFIDDQKERK